MSKIESGIRTVLAFNEAFNHHDVAGMMQLVRDDCTFEHHAPAPDGAAFTGKEAIVAFWQAFFVKSPQIQRKIEDAWGFGRRCVLHWRYAQEDASDQPSHIRGVDVFRVQDGLIHEILSYVKGE